MCDHLRLFRVLCITLGLKSGTQLEPGPRALTSMQWNWRTNGNRVVNILRLKCVLAHPGPVTKGLVTHRCQIIKSSFPAWKVFWFYVIWMEDDIALDSDVWKVELEVSFGIPPRALISFIDYFSLPILSPFWKLLYLMTYLTSWQLDRILSVSVCTSTLCICGDFYFFRSSNLHFSNEPSSNLQMVLRWLRVINDVFPKCKSMHLSWGNMQPRGLLANLGHSYLLQGLYVLGVGIV